MSNWTFRSMDYS